MQLRLILPGLLWPDKVFHDICADLELPALSWLLGRGRLAPWPATQPPALPEQLACAAFGLANQPPPYAALRLLGEGGAPGEAAWLCADPVHLNIEQRRLTLAHDAPSAQADEMAEIVAALAPLFAEIGSFEVGLDGHGYLRLTRLPDLQTTPPAQASNLNSMLPQGPDALHWRKLINEAQMLLHTLPCNQHREQQGQPRLNALWLWGGGCLPPHPLTNNDRHKAYDSLHGQGPILHGLACLAGTRLEPVVPAQTLLCAARRNTRALLLLDTLQTPARAYDALQWRQALLELERDWFAPLRAALTNGHLQHLQLTALGDEGSCELFIARRDGLRFWRRPRPLHSLAAPRPEPRS